MKKKFPCLKPSTTANSFASVSSIHGVFYIFSAGISLIDRLIWTVLVIVGIVMATLLCHESYVTWMKNPVITTLDDTSRSIRDINFPAITICNQGLNMVAVEKVIQRNFENWREENKRIKRNIECADEKELFLKDKFKLLSENQNIFNIIKTFFVQDVDDFIKNDGVRENILACRDKGNEMSNMEVKRSKRSISRCEESALCAPVSCSTSIYTESQACDCGEFGKIVKMESMHSDNYEDRTWKITCENIAQYKADKTGNMQGSIASDWEISPFLTNAFVSGLSSGFRKWKKDRMYRVRWSRNDSFKVGNCGDWEQVSYGDELKVGALRAKEVIGAIKSKYLTQNLDREFYVKVCTLSSEGKYRNKCKTSSARSATLEDKS